MKSIRKPNTAAERSKILAAYREFVEKDDKIVRQLKETGISDEARLSDAQFAASRGISRSTLHRWLTAERRKVVSLPPNLSDVNRSIQILTSHDAQKWELNAAALNFSAWLVFSTSYFQRCARTLSLAVVHFKPEGELKTLEQFPPEVQQVLQRFITVGLLKRLSVITNINDSAYGEYSYVPLLDTRYTERDVLRSVGCKFMDAHQRGDAVSINKVSALLENGRLLDGLFLRPAFFASLWKYHASTIPFICAENTVGIDWHLEFDGRSGERLEALTSDRRRVGEFFRVARLYVDRFRQALHQSALQRLVMPDLGHETLA